jgi:hypothetical protein
MQAEDLPVLKYLQKIGKMPAVEFDAETLNDG